MLRKVFFAASAVLAMASVGSAATITYTLDLSTPGTFQLKAATSNGDNGGLALFSVPLTGNVLTVDNRAPNVINSANFAPAGFGQIRSGDITSATANPTIAGAQDVVNGPAANRVYGIGQETSSYVLKGITPAFTPDATSDVAWTNPIVLAVGTYTGTLGFNTQSVDLVGNAWSAVGSGTAPAATVVTQVISVPEPATVTLLGLAIVGGLGVIRRRAA